MNVSTSVTACRHCKAELAPSSHRSDRKFCSDRCKQADYRRRRKIKEKPVEALVRGNNADLMKNVASLYAADPDITIADVTYGKGAFWRKTPHLKITGSDLLTVPDRPYDFRSLPYDDQSFDIVVFDPPYLVWPGNHMSDDRYRNAETTKGIDYKGVRQLYQDGLLEAARVARRQIWVKCKDTVEGPRQRFLHVHLLQDAEALGLRGRDLFVLDATSRMPNNHWSTQKHARKTMSYLWVFDVIR